MRIRELKKHDIKHSYDEQTRIHTLSKEYKGKIFEMICTSNEGDIIEFGYLAGKKVTHNCAYGRFKKKLSFLVDGLNLQVEHHRRMMSYVDYIKVD